MAIRYAKRPRTAGIAAVPLESKAQEAVFEWAKYQLVPADNLPRGFDRRLTNFMFAVPNGMMLAGNRAQRARYMNAMKKRGFKDGVSDIILAWPNRAGTPGAFIEMKRDKTCRPTPAQDAFLANMAAAGYLVAVTAGFEQTVEIITEYLNGT